LVKRRLNAAKLPQRLSPHSFRVTAITDLLTQGVPLEDVQYLAGHAEPRTTTLYDRRKKKVTRNIVERIPIRRVRQDSCSNSSRIGTWRCSMIFRKSIAMRA